MTTTSETAIVAVIWSLTSIGIFFSLRRLLRKLKEKLQRRSRTDDK